MKEYGVCYSGQNTDTDQVLARSRERVYPATGIVHDPTMQVELETEIFLVTVLSSGQQRDVCDIFSSVQEDHD